MDAVRLVMVLAAVVSSVQAAGWEQKAGFELLLNQGYYSPNWQGDERTSGSLTASFDHLAARQLASVVRFEHGAALAFGQQLTEQDSPASGWKVSKSEDKVLLDELIRFTLGGWIDPLASLQLKSQFTDSRGAELMLFNPLQLLETFGGGRKFFEDSIRTLTTELGAAARQAFDRRDTVSLLADAGVSWTSLFRTILFTQNAGYMTKLVMYKPLVVLSGAAETGTWPQVDWVHELSARFNKALSGKVFAQVLFDERVNERPRLKQTLGMGLSLAWPAN